MLTGKKIMSENTFLLIFKNQKKIFFFLIIKSCSDKLSFETLFDEVVWKFLKPLTSGIFSGKNSVKVLFQIAYMVIII